MTLTVDRVLLYSIIGAVALVYFPYLVVVYGRFKVGFDMSAPRAMFDKLPAYAQRAMWAHQNSFEALSIYSAAALMAYVTRVDSPSAITAALAFLAARFLFSIFYILNIPLGRSLMFGVGSACSLTLFILSTKVIQ